MNKEFRKTLKTKLEAGVLRLADDIGMFTGAGILDDIAKGLGMLQAIEMVETLDANCNCENDCDDCSCNEDTTIDVGEFVVSGFPTATEQTPDVREIEVESLDATVSVDPSITVTSADGIEVKLPPDADPAYIDAVAGSNLATTID